MKWESLWTKIYTGMTQRFLKYLSHVVAIGTFFRDVIFWSLWRFGPLPGPKSAEEEGEYGAQVQPWEGWIHGILFWIWVELENQ
jgi:hypothetical protein